MKSWNEIRKEATAFSKRWKNAYDAERRLVQVSYSDQSLDFAIARDAFGRETNVTDAAGREWRSEYDRFDSILNEEFSGGAPSQATGALSRAFDTAGRLTGLALSMDGVPKGGFGCVYSADGLLAAVEATNAAGRAFSVAYSNHAGRCIGYAITTPGGDTIRRAVSRDFRRADLVNSCETTFNDVPIESLSYTYDALSRPTLRTAGGTGVPSVQSSFAYSERGEVVSAQIGSSLFTHEYDFIGNVTKYIDESGNVVAEYAYDAFGKTIAQSGTMADVFRHRYSTKCLDPETGLYYYGYRFYSPTLMRWLNRDPIGEDGGLNLYGFCGNCAVCRYDKDGRAHFEVRRLSGLPAILSYSCFAQIIGVVPAMILDLGLADKLNIEILHEHLFYDDGDNVGFGDKGRFLEGSKKGYTRRDMREYDDCIMHEAEKLVPVPAYSLIGFGSPKYNCQDYAAALRRKYAEIENDEEVKKKCGKCKK